MKPRRARRRRPRTRRKLFETPTVARTMFDGYEKTPDRPDTLG